MATAARELLEETGRVAAGSRLIGQIWAESGLSGDAVNVVIIHVDPHAELAAAEYPAQRWIDIDRIGPEVANNQIRDGISIAALALAWSKGEFSADDAHSQRHTSEVLAPTVNGSATDKHMGPQ